MKHMIAHGNVKGFSSGHDEKTANLTSNQDWEPLGHNVSITSVKKELEGMKVNA